MPVPANRWMTPAGGDLADDVVAAVGDEDVALGVLGGAAGVVQRRAGRPGRRRRARRRPTATRRTRWWCRSAIVGDARSRRCWTRTPCRWRRTRRPGGSGRRPGRSRCRSGSAAPGWPSRRRHRPNLGGGQGTCGAAGGQGGGRQGRGHGGRADPAAAPIVRLLGLQGHSSDLRGRGSLAMPGPARTSGEAFPNRKPPGPS